MIHIINVFISKNNVQNMVFAQLEKLKHMITKSSPTYIIIYTYLISIVGIPNIFLYIVTNMLK